MPLFRKKTPPLGGEPSGQLGGKSGRVNDWPKCRQCWHRIPRGSIHLRCQRASADAGVIPLTHNAGVPCCPGWCRVCGICWDRGHKTCNQCGRCILACPGACPECGECLDLCPGHNKGSDKTDG